MKNRALFTILFAGLMACTSWANASDTTATDDDARAVISKAIKAQGGEEAIAKAKAGRAKGKGKLNVNGQMVDVEMDTVFQWPDKQKSHMTIELQGQTIVVIQTVNGDKAWINTQGFTQDVEGDKLKAMQEGRHASYVGTLLPLLKDKAFTLALLKETKIDDKTAIGVKVSAKDRKDIELYFDKATSLPLKTVRPAMDGQTMKPVTLEIFHKNHKDFDGVKLSSELVYHQDGNKIMEMQLVEFKRLEKVDDKEFEKPE